MKTENKKQINKNCSAFTLIELLVTISIIGILSTLLLSNFNAARERARDAQRKSDLKNIQIALRLYYNDYGGYPTASGTTIAGCGALGKTSCVWGETWSAGTGGTVYMSTLPKDPLDDGEKYMYRYVYTDGDNYTLSACLENRSDEKGIPIIPAESWCPTNKKIVVKP